MTRKLTNVVTTEPFAIGDAAKATRFDYFTLDNFVCPIILFDHVHMRATGFPPHPHAGLAVFSYLMDGSRGALRDRDSLNPEILVEPGDLLWFQMASGMIHEENPAVDGEEVDQMQVWINLSPGSQKLPPATMLLKSRDIPEVNVGGARVRVALGGFGGAASPLVPTEPFTFLDIRAATASSTEIVVPARWTGMAYVVSGGMEVRSGDETATVKAGQAIGVRSDSGVRLVAAGDARALYFARPILDNPPIIQGMYAMDSQEAIDKAKRRFHGGGFGHVQPYPKLLHPERPYVPAGQDPDLTVTPVVEKQATVRHYDEGWWKLHFQFCRYEYSDYETAHGYRFVWEDPDGNEKPYRTGGYIPYMEYIAELLAAAKREGWGDIPYRDSF